MRRRRATGETDESDAWNRRLGLAWARVLRRRGLDPAGTVVEVGPGFADKVGLGLAELAFRGSLIVVEPDEDARAWVVTRYRQLLPGAEVLATGQAVPDASFLAGRAVDLLAANHVLDDLLLNAAVMAGEAGRLFAGMRPGSACSPAFVRAWRRLLAAPEGLDRSAGRVVDDLATFVRTVRPGLTILNQYASWRHRQHGLEAIHEHSLSVMRRLGRNLGAGRLVGAAGVRWLVHTGRGAERATEVK